MKIKILKNISKTIIIFFAVVFLFLGLAKIVNAACTETSSNSHIWNCSPDNTSLDNLLNHGSPAGLDPQDIVNVSSGTEAWAAPLVVPFGIALRGAGIDQTILNISSCGGNAGIIYNPSGYFANNYAFELTGLTINMNQPGATCAAVGLNAYNGADAKLTPQTKIYVHDNKFIGNNIYSTRAVKTWGAKGVVARNIVDSFDYQVESANGPGDSRWWDAWGQLTFGDFNRQMFFEDNVFLNSGATFAQAQAGGQYSLRYNTFITSGSPQSAFDYHGNYGQFWSSFGGEIYGNKIISGNYVNVIGHRGGKVLLFYNDINASGSITTNVREEHRDSENATINQPQHVTDTYVWNNRQKTTGSLIAATLSQDCCTNMGCSGTMCLPSSECCYNGTGVGISENIDWFNSAAVILDEQKTGIGCGPSKPSKCVKGTGFWETSQSCTDLTGLTGAAGIGGYTRTSNIAGTLYKCTAANTWTAYFAPEKYPHPFRSQAYPNYNPITTCTPGDANNDKSINISDVQTCINVILGTDTTHQACSDMNTSSTVDITDCQAIINKILNP